MKTLRILIFGILTASFSGCEILSDLFGSKADDFEIVQGKGIAKIRLDSDYGEISKLIGEASQEFKNEEERKECLNFNLKPDKMMVFFKKFENGVVYLDYPKFKTKEIPVFKLFFKNNSLIYIRLTSANFSEEIKIYRIEKKLSFGDNKDKMTETLGSDYIPYEIEPQVFEYIYAKQGISFVLEKNKITVIDIFKPLDSSETEEFMKGLKNQ